MIPFLQWSVAVIDIAGTFEVAVIGAGVVGLAIARRLAQVGAEVLVLEREAAVGTVTSSRNSEVIHAGIYYPTDSLKARLCVAGRRALYDYCRQRHIPHAMTGKYIVATESGETAALEGLLAQGLANGLDDLVLRSAAEVRRHEPAVECFAALYSPSSGIVDSHALMLALRGDAEAAGALFALRSSFLRGQVKDDGHVLFVGGGDEETVVQADLVINSAGLDAWQVAHAMQGFPKQHIPPRHLCKGVYFNLRGKSPFRHLIYPLPGARSLGIHAGLDLDGRCRFGPDAEWVNAIDYDVDPARESQFRAAVLRYYPALAEGALQPDYAGVRPKIQGPGEPPHDFVIQGPTEGPDSHGVAGLIHLFGIESPGLTASLAIADHVVGLAGYA